MILNWRDAEYTFINRTLKGGKDKDNRNSNIENSIFAFDTESVMTPGRYEPICVQLSGRDGFDHLEWLEPNANALERFIWFFLQAYPLQFEDGDCFMFGHNLIYDWGQLCKNYPPLLAIMRTGIGLDHEIKLFDLASGERVYLKKDGLFTGTAPYFSLLVKRSNTQKFTMHFRDTFAFFPAALSRLGKELGIKEQKMDRAQDIGLRDFRLEPDSPDKDYFVEYAKLDARITRLVAERIRDLHAQAGMKKIRVSGPGYAINLLLHGLPDGHEIKAGSDDDTIMQLVMDCYAGGRTGGVYHGYTPNVTVLDIHSSYPASMLTLPSFGRDMAYYSMNKTELATMTQAELLEIIDEAHCFLRIDGEEMDARYPAMIRSIKGKLTPVFGVFENLATTGIELSVGLKSGSVRVDKIRELVVLLDEPDTLKPFAEFARSAYERKATAAKGSAEYTSAKLALNATYGKLIESRTETPVDDEVRDVILPYVRGMESEFAQMYYGEYIKMLAEEPGAEFPKYINEKAGEVYDNFSDTDIEHCNFGFLSLTKLAYGRYVVPAAAALITATSRARLLVAMRSLDAIYWDTDSVFVERLDLDTANARLVAGSAWLPGYAQGLCIGDELGDLDAEIVNASGYLAGIKRYFLATETYWTCEDRDRCKTCDNPCMVKKALHGIPAAPYQEARNMIEQLATGSSYCYTSRPKPLTVREAKTTDEIGLFVAKDYESKFSLDERLEWTKTENGWTGSVREQNTLLK